VVVTFQETYIETVEDIHRYHVNQTGKRLFVNFLDTAGSIPFPAMRQLYIRKAQAFVLVYYLGCSLRKFRQNIRQDFHYRPSSTHQMFLPGGHFLHPDYFLHCLSLHKLKLQNDLKCRESMRIKKNRKSKLSGKEKPNGTSSAPFCEGKHNSKSNERSQDTKTSRNECSSVIE
jgi:hypothetical protein